MPPKIRLITITICIFIVAYVFELVRRRHLSEEYSMGWLITGVLMLLMATWLDLLAKVTDLVGSKAVTSTLFFLGLMFLVVICLHFSIRISNLTNQVRKLSQWLAIQNHEIGLIRKESNTIGNEQENNQTQTTSNKTDDSSKENVLINENFKNN